MKTGKKIYLAFILIFVSGLLVGAGIMYFVGRKRITPPPSFNVIKEHVCKKISKKLDLDESQRKYMNVVMTEHFAAAKEMHQAMEPQIIALINKTHKKLSAKLNPVQKQKLDKIREKIIRRIKRRSRD